MSNENIGIYCNVDTETLEKFLNDIRAIKDEIEKINNTPLSVLSGVSDSIGIIASLTTVLDTISASKGVMGKEIKKFVDLLDKEAESVRKSAKNIGEYLAEGIIAGLKESKPKIDLLVEELGEDNIIKTTCKTLDIHSPSKVMKRIGGYIAEGLGDGIKDGSKDVERAMKSVTNTVEDSAKKTSKVKFGFGGIATVAGIVASLVGYFANMMSTNEELSGKMQEILSTTYTKPRVLDI